MTSILKVDTIQDADGNNIINESGNTITIGASGDTTNIIGTLQNDGAAVGGVNTPAFFVTLSSDQTISDATATKIQLDNEILDTANAFASYKFTPQTSGKYFIFCGLMANGQVDANLNVFEIYLQKNSTVISQSTITDGNNQGRENQTTLSCIVDMNGSSDYIELYGYVDTENGGSTLIKGHSDPRARTYLGGYKIIE